MFVYGESLNEAEREGGNWRSFDIIIMKKPVILTISGKSPSKQRDIAPVQRRKRYNFIGNRRSGLLMLRLNEQLRGSSLFYLLQSRTSLLYPLITWLWKVLSSKTCGPKSFRTWYSKLIPFSSKCFYIFTQICVYMHINIYR